MNAREAHPSASYTRARTRRREGKPLRLPLAIIAKAHPNEKGLRADGFRRMLRTLGVISP